jgi:diamine N-acetyltransferase
MITVRQANIMDCELIGLLGRITFRETFGVLFSEHEGELKEYLDSTFAPIKINASIQKPENRYWIASVNGLPVGYGKMKFASPNVVKPADTSAQLQKIYILAEFISQHVGSVLMEQMMITAAQAGIDSVWLTVLSSNNRAIRFYQSKGWAQTGETDFVIGTQSLHYLKLQITV